MNSRYVRLNRIWGLERDQEGGNLHHTGLGVISHVE